MNITGVCHRLRQFSEYLHIKKTATELSFSFLNKLLALKKKIIFNMGAGEWFNTLVLAEDLDLTPSTYITTT